MTIPPTGSFGDDAAPRGLVTVEQLREAEGLLPTIEYKRMPLIQRTHALPAKLIADAFGIPMEMIYGRVLRRSGKLIRTPGAPSVLAYLRNNGWKVGVQHMRFVRDLERGTTFPAGMVSWRTIYRDALRLVPLYETDGEGTIVKIREGTMPRYELKQTGGLTTVTLRRVHPDSAEWPTHMGQVLCHPNDNFCKSDGLILALERALADAGLAWRA